MEPPWPPQNTCKSTGVCSLTKIMNDLNLEPMMHHDHIIVEINKGMYGLPQAGKLANEYFQELLLPAGYVPMPHTPGLWHHQTRSIVFTLVVDDFGIKYTDPDDITHLLTTLGTHYEYKIDYSGTKYCSLSLEWDYNNKTCDLSIPGYVERALKRFTHPKPPGPEDSPYKWTRPNYGAKIHYAPDTDTSEPLPPNHKKLIQEIVGVFLFYARAVDMTMLPALGSLAAQQACPTEQTYKALTQFLNYVTENMNHNGFEPRAAEYSQGKITN